MTNDYDYILMNDGWQAFLNGKPESTCPYWDDGEAAELWLKGWRNADWYHNRKENIDERWKNIQS